MSSSKGFDTGKVKSDIQDLRSKKEALLLSLQRDVEGIEPKLAESYRHLGELVYGMIIKGEDSIGSLTNEAEAITKHLDNINAKTKKSSEVAARYDEEIEMLENLLGDDEPDNQERSWGGSSHPASTEPSSSGYCLSCGAANTPGVNLNCKSCGQVL